MRAQIIAELATAHGGDLDVAADLIRAAADAGADWAKIQTYSLDKLNPADPQYAWLRQAHLDRAAHERLLTVCQQVGIRFLSTPMDAASLQLLRELGLTTFKIASSESGNRWWVPQRHEQWFVSYPWGRCLDNMTCGGLHYALTAIPLYPTPLECVGQATLLDGWSCHCEGLSACQWAIAHGAQVLEAHLCLPGKSRVTKFDKTPESFRLLRRFADDCQTMRSGVATRFRERWGAA